MKKTTHTNPDGKIIEETVHEDGRKSVKVTVGALNVKETDEATLTAKKVIEERLLPTLNKASVNTEEASLPIFAVVLHKPTNIHAASKISEPFLPGWLKACYDSFPTQEGQEKRPEDFLVIKIDGERVEVGQLSA